MGRALIAVLAVAACALTGTTSIASAASLEYGFCKAVKAGTGTFGNGGCTLSGGKANHDWSALTSPETVPVTTSGTLALQLGSRGSVGCSTESSNTGTFGGGADMRGVVLHLSGCVGHFEGLGEGACTGEGGEEGAITSAEIVGEKGVISKTALKDKDGLALSAENGEPIFAFLCHDTFSGFVIVEVGGSVIVPVASEKMVTKQKLVFKHPAPENFVGGPKKVLWARVEGEGVGVKPPELLAEIELSTSRALELRDCTLLGC